MYIETPHHPIKLSPHPPIKLSRKAVGSPHATCNSFALCPSKRLFLALCRRAARSAIRYQNASNCYHFFLLHPGDDGILPVQRLSPVDLTANSKLIEAFKSLSDSNPQLEQQ